MLLIKRIIDIIGSVLGLIIFSPLFLVIVLLIKTTMPGPVFFKQSRVGKGKKEFYIIKFRTMNPDYEAEKKLDFSKDKERTTFIGNILRRTKIDELPQLINVLVGDMSLVGPRPTIMRQVIRYGPYELLRLDVRPGMTGLAQIKGGKKLKWSERIRYDIEYINNYSLQLDLKILFNTLLVIIRGEKKIKYHNPKKECK